MKRQAVCAMMALLVSLFCSLSGSASNLSTDLIGYWQFNGNGADSSGNGNTVTLNGGGFGPGLFLQGLTLNGVEGTDAAMTSDNTAFDFGSSDFTMQVWVNFKSTGSQVLLEKFSGASGPGWSFTTLGPNTFRFAEGTSGLFDSKFLPTFPTGVWQQFIAERSGDNWYLYYDDAQVGSITSSL